MDRWISTDKADDVLGSIRHTLIIGPTLTNDPSGWKWVALSLHSAIQGACVCHLTTTCPPIGAITKQNAAEWLTYHEKRRDGVNAIPPQTYLMMLPELLKAIRKPFSAGDRSNSNGILLNDQEFQWLNRFHIEIRNQLIHFEPKGWSIEVSGFPDLAALISRLILEIIDVGWGFRHLSESFQCELRQNLSILPGVLRDQITA